ncbi:hypothetical protein Taro_001473 [Colocasia esculenta]|uniref:Uncharacterized protein n=1 Tax=Colocasia esculenta TaxID=4460 RepID=A0A843TA11_COLES|nr:hypothetical protein [Colocasia esculenta]
MRASRLLGLSCATSQRFSVVLIVLPRLFALCLALEGLSRSEVRLLSSGRARAGRRRRGGRCGPRS